MSLAPVSAADGGGVSQDYFDEYKRWAEHVIALYKEWGEQLQKSMALLESENRDLREENDRLRSDLQYETRTSSNLKSQISQLRSEISSLERESRDDSMRYNSLKTLYDRQKSDLGHYASKPQVEITNQEVHLRLFDSKGNEYNWSMPIETYEAYVEYSPRYEYLYLYNENTDEDYSVIDYRPFVQESFGETIDDIYHNSDSNSDFIWEVWYIVSQLTVYSEDIGDDPRYATETLTRGGGDCEDLVILILDMIKSSSHTRNWDLEMWYIDADNPTRPLDLNHVIAIIDDGQYSHFIEATAGPDWEYYPDGVNGWGYDV